jgi:activator of HSP90 ATPase
MDSKLHSELIGSKTVISSEISSNFSAFDGDLKGKILYVKSNKMIAQTWRGRNWGKDQLDSILILVFNEAESGTELEMIHANVPEEEAEGIKKGWFEYYWTPWRNYIKNKK